MLCIVGDSYAQEVSYKGENQSISEILEQISDKYEVYFSYANNSLPSNKISVKVENQPLFNFLNDLLRPFGLVAEEVDEGFIVIKTIAEQGVELNGIVLDAATNDPLEFALIRHQGVYQGTYSDVKGHFSYYSDDPNNTFLEISYIGYRTLVVNMAEMYTQVQDTIRLLPAFNELDGIVVREYVNTGVAVGDDMSSIDLYTQQLEVVPGLPEQDALYSLQVLPGISSVSESASEINIRGSSSDQVALYWENIPVYHSGHYFGIISAFIPPVITKIDVHRNKIPIQYSGATSGLIEMNADYSIPRNVMVQADANLTHSDLFTIVPLVQGKASLMLAARRSINDWIETPTFDSYGARLFDGSRIDELQQFVNEEPEFDFQNVLRFWDVNAKLTYQPNIDTEWTASFFNSRNELDFNSADDLLNNVDSQNHRVNAWGVNSSIKRNWNLNFSTSLSASYTSYTMDYNFTTLRVSQTFFDEREEDDFDPEDEEEPEEEPEEEDEPEEEETSISSSMDDLVVTDSTSDIGIWNNSLENIEIRWLNTIQFDRGSSLTFGAQLNYLRTYYELNEFNLVEINLDEDDRTNGMINSGFLQWDYKPWENVTIQPALRANYYHFLDQLTFDPQVNIYYRPAYWFGFKSSIGIYRQYLRTLQRFDNTITNRTESLWVISNGDEIPLVETSQVTAGFYFNRYGWLFDVDGYYKLTDGVTSTNLAFLLDEDSFFTNGEERVYGVDIMLRKRFKRYKSWMSYSYSESRSTYNGISDRSFPSFLDRPHQFNWTHAVNMGQFEFSLGWSFASGLPYTEPIRADRFFIDDDEFFRIVIGQVNNERLPDYHRLDTSVWYSFPGNRQANWSGRLGVSLLNIYNRNNLLSRSFFIDTIEEEETAELISEERALLGLTPNISLKITF